MNLMAFNPVSNKKLYIQIYSQILSEIQQGSFKVGDKLPTERELCEQFGVSRAPVRQALSALELNGYIYSRQGEGVYVQNNNVDTENNRSSIILNKIAPEDIVEARMEIEPLIVKYATIRANDEDINALKSILEKMEKETRNGEYVPQTDEELHTRIAQSTHNDLFIGFMADIVNAMKQQEMWDFIRDRTVTRPDYRDVNFEEHKLIINAIEEHDGEKAAKLMMNHMQNLYDRYWKNSLI
ncbi:FadR family transcriptional regulator [Bacilli bacterium]|nr:transcriptional regulator [Bacilli bacterium]PZD90193.1 transcriptional regulator [Bacilli bacterium]PZD92087.1 transcriptional regulator [Bacilli bacterium]RCO06971.1 FadR family transcriptional regulator [Bacilli bacterium]RCO08131.1 FadR family transcriptional regulator [Bacilli bacterium]